MKQIFILTAALLTCMGMRAPGYGHRLRTSPDRGEQQGAAGQRTTYLFAEVRE